MGELKQQTGLGGGPQGRGEGGRGGFGITDVLQATQTCLLERLTILDKSLHSIQSGTSCSELTNLQLRECDCRCPAVTVSLTDR